ncbi:MAG: PIG-L family deacetylase [Anaerolineae bacterium]|nr:PIG-L family deacetylase [Anaerolineae bacterium]
MMSDRRMLFSLAHPDDESFGSGGMIAKYVAQGVDTYLICATNGDVGTVKPEFLNGYSSIAELRLAELACASAKLGFKKVFTLGYMDSGMMGSATSENSECLWQAPQDEVIRRVVEVIRQVRPQVVVTFNKYGGYGHPDHIAIQKATTAAFSLAGKPEYVTGDLAPYAPQKLYYTSIPATIVRYGIVMTRLRGKDPRKLGVNHDIDLQMVLDNVEPTHSKIDIRDYYTIWDEASACHASQLGGRSTTVPLWLRKVIAPWQGLTRVYPPPANGHIDETDVFTGVRPDSDTTATT